MRPALWIAPALAALSLWACTGGSSDTDRPADGATDAPTRSKVQASCAAIEDIESYRYSMTLRFDSPASQEPDEGTPNPLSEFTEALTDLLSDMQLEGAFVAPDRSRILVHSGGAEWEVLTIGDKSWIRVGATWQEQDPPGEDVIPTAVSICEDQVERLAPCLAPASGEEELVNGIETVHYRLDEADLRGKPECLGRSGEEGLPSEFGVDIWLQRDDGWPVRFEVVSSDVDEEGRPISQELFLEFSDIDDPNIGIDPPPVSPAQT